VLVTDDFVFVHIPKTGGSFIQKAIADNMPVRDHEIAAADGAWSHTPYSSLPTHWRHLPAFCVVRNPWDWYVSWFHYQMARGPRRRARAHGGDPWGKWAVWEGALRSGEADFQEAVTRACTGDFEHPLRSVMREEGIDLYSARVREIIGAALDQPNFTVLRFEQGLRKPLLRYLRAQTEVPPGLAAAIRRSPPIRVSEHGPYPDYYDDGLRDLVGEKARWLCGRFQYKFRRGSRQRTQAKS
jgi:hypothetical protein